MKIFETALVLLIVLGILFYVSKMFPESFNWGGYFLADDRVRCPDYLGNYYKKRYTNKQNYAMMAPDTMDYNESMKHQGTMTHEGAWKEQMQHSMKNSYTDAKGNSFGAAKARPSNAQIDPAGKGMMQMDNKDAGMHPAMQDNAMPLNATDLLPNPCLTNSRDWANVYTQCDNMLGGRNFVQTQDEHFTNQVLDTRCTRNSSLDLRREPPIMYSDVSIWLKPSTCKNIYDYIRPSLDC
jgi:hypothetical protein